VRGLGFTADQLLRRPPPGASPGGPGAWCRLGFANDEVLVENFFPNNWNNVQWDVQANNFPDVFAVEGDSIGGVDNAIQCLVDGIYAVTWGLYLDVFTPMYPTDSPIFVGFQSMSYTQEMEMFGFPALGGSQDAFLEMPSPILTGAKTFRSGPDYDAIWMGISINDGADSDLQVIGGDLNITYMEIHLLCLADPAYQGDPNDFITAT
jgi:hypothetical protein